MKQNMYDKETHNYGLPHPSTKEYLTDRNHEHTPIMKKSRNSIGSGHHCDNVPDEVQRCNDCIRFEDDCDGIEKYTREESNEK